MFPITEKYIENEYTLGGMPLKINNEEEIKVIERKAKRVLNMLKKGIKFVSTQPNAFAILEKLKKEKQ